MFIFDALGYEKGDALEIIRSYIGRHKFKEGKIDGGNNSKVNEYDLKLEKLKQKKIDLLQLNLLKILFLF